MLLKAIRKMVVGRMASFEALAARRTKADKAREADKAPHRVAYFHEAGDPYSHLMVQLLPEICERYEIELQVYLVPPPADSAAPDRQRLEVYGRRDAAQLARRAGLSFDDPGAALSPERLHAAELALADHLGQPDFLDRALAIGEALWQGQPLPSVDTSAARLADVLAAGAARRDALGHYLGGTLHYGNEWFWGPDRLHYLEDRLQELGAVRDVAPSGPCFAPPALEGSGQAARSEGLELHWYLSFRSPYTAIVADRVKVLAEAYGADLKIRFVLPMVMRGLAVPRRKGAYIMSDVAREAHRLGTPFGNISDPVGKPVERGYAVLNRAIELGRGYEFARSFLTGVWSEGIDAGTDRGLQQLVERAGLDWAEMKPLLEDEGWRQTEDRNQAEMLSYEIWGVPSFRVGDVAVWGQDRLWVIEDALRAATLKGDA